MCSAQYYYYHYYLSNPCPLSVTSCIPTQFYAFLSDLLPTFHISGSLTATCNNMLAIHLVTLTQSCTNIYSAAKHHVATTFCTKFPLCCSGCCSLWAPCVLLTKYSLNFLNRLPFPFQTQYPLYQCFSTFVRPRPSKFIFHKTRARSQQIYSSVPFHFF